MRTTSLLAVLVALLPVIPSVGENVSVASPAVLPSGWTMEVYAQPPGPISLRRVNDQLYVGAYHSVWREGSLVAQGNFTPAAVDVAVDGTLYVADANLWGRLLKYPPGSSMPQVAVYGMTYCWGVAVLPDGNVLVVDCGWIGWAAADGRILRLQGSEMSAGKLPRATDTSLVNPVSVEMGPDGYVYFIDRGLLWANDAIVYRFLPGSMDAKMVVSGLTAPFDTAMMPDGSLLMTEQKEILRWDPAAKELSVWASGFVSLHGIDVAPNGDVFVADAGASAVYRIHPAAEEIPVRLTPRTLNLRSRGNFVKAEFEEAIAPLEAVSVDPVVQFDREGLTSVLTTGDRVLRIEGLLPDGTAYYAEDTIRVIH